MLCHLCSGSGSGSEERAAATAVTLPSGSSDVANTAVTRAKLGQSQSLRVRLDSFPVGKYC